MAEQQASTSQQVYKVSRSDLPLCCPNRHQDVADLHPRVYLPIEKSGKAICPYCGASYELQD